jgi:5-methylcytosine-specific restriction protein B
LANFTNVLSPKELGEIRDNSRLGWTRLDMVRGGLLGGDRGLWRLTPLARLYLDAHQNDPLEPPRHFSSKRSEDAEVTEVVSVTETRAYEIPILSIARNGRLLKEEIVSRVFSQLRDRLLPGDTRIMPHTEAMVASYRTGRAISNLWRDGRLKNPARGYWEITQKGRDRLKAEEAFFNIAMFQGTSKATVLMSSGSQVKGNGTGLNLDTLKAILGPGLHQDLRDHLQLDQEPTPTSPQGLTRNLIFYGPPGTGKTRLAKLLAQALTEEELPGTDSRWRLVQFHPSYTYQDFVQGLRPSLESTGLTYIMTTGPFLEVCAHAEAEPDRFYVLVIDEINRGNPARIFGELIYALEYRGEEVQLSLEATLRVPPNLVVIGTMNSSDRNLALSDVGLRRRFGFFRVEPDPEVISDLMVGNAELVAGTLEFFNVWLEKTLGRDYMLGHSYFLNPNYHPFTAATIERIWRLDVYPLMEEYFSGKPELLAEAKGAWKKAINTTAARLARGE